MTWTIDDAKVFRFRREIDCRSVNRDTALSLLFVSIKEVSEIERCFIEVLGDFCNLMHRLLADLTELMQQLASESTLASIYVTNNDHVKMATKLIPIHLHLVVNIWIDSIESLLVNDYCLCSVFLSFFLFLIRLLYFAEAASLLGLFHLLYGILFTLLLFFLSLGLRLLALFLLHIDAAPCCILLLFQLERCLSAVYVELVTQQ